MSHEAEQAFDTLLASLDFPMFIATTAAVSKEWSATRLIAPKTPA